LDLANYNLNDYLPEILNSKIIDYFIKEGETNFFKFTVFVPLTHKNKIIDAIEKSGAGNIGKINSKCHLFSNLKGNKANQFLTLKWKPPKSRF